MLLVWSHLHATIARMVEISLWQRSTHLSGRVVLVIQECRRSNPSDVGAPYMADETCWVVRKNSHDHFRLLGGRVRKLHKPWLVSDTGSARETIECVSVFWVGVGSKQSYIRERRISLEDPRSIFSVTDGSILGVGGMAVG